MPNDNAPGVRAKKIKEILVLSDNLVASNFADEGTVFINNFSTDSRKINAGDCYIAYAGVTQDGHAFVEKAISNGANLIVVENSEAIPPTYSGIYFHVKSGRKAWAWLESEKHGNPADKIKMIGVTGTNGKSSTVWMIRNLLKKVNKPCLMLGTIGNFLGDTGLDSKHTTPDPPEYFKLLSEAVALGIEYCVMEVASQAIFHHKLGPSKFDVAVFTSFTRDHLDLHSTMENYFECKARLFTQHLANKATAIISTSVVDNAPTDLHPSTPNRIYYGRSSPNPSDSLYAIDITQETLDSTHFNLTHRGVGRKIILDSIGGFLVDNFCASIIVLESLGIRIEDSNFSSDFITVPGRLERVPNIGRNDFTVIVDYAHSPDAALQVLTTLKKIAPRRIITVFGCGGDRDTGKRPEMASIIEAHSDIIYATSDNPRNENPEKILDDILAGSTSQEKWHRITDRELAIFSAIRSARKGDCVVILGKGHEDYQIVGDIIIDFDDRVIAQKALLEVGKNV